MQTLSEKDWKNGSKCKSTSANRIERNWPNVWDSKIHRYDLSNAFKMNLSNTAGDDCAFIYTHALGRYAPRNTNELAPPSPPILNGIIKIYFLRRSSGLIRIFRSIAFSTMCKVPPHSVFLPSSVTRTRITFRSISDGFSSIEISVCVYSKDPNISHAQSLQSLRNIDS